MYEKCWTCRNLAFTLKIIVPKDQSREDFIEKNQNFQSNVIAIVREKPQQYCIWCRSKDSIKLLSFKLSAGCSLKLKKRKPYSPCLGYDKKEEYENRINDIIYSVP
jgi:hypothetical protein